MKRFSILIALLVLFVPAACQKADREDLLAYEYTPAQFAEESRVAKCRDLGEVQARPSTTRASSNVNLAKKNARDNLAQKAGEMGASHVVFQGFQGNRRPVAHGRAYKCD